MLADVGAVFEMPSWHRLVCGMMKYPRASSHSNFLTYAINEDVSKANCPHAIPEYGC